MIGTAEVARMSTLRRHQQITPVLTDIVETSNRAAGRSSNQNLFFTHLKDEVVAGFRQVTFKTCQ